MPKPLRHLPLFEIKEHAEGYLLVPLEVARAREPLPTTQLSKIWLAPEVHRYFFSEMVPILQVELKKQKQVVAAFLYGSRARGDALSNSDFDIGLLCEKYPTLNIRNEIGDSLNQALAAQLKVVQDRGSRTELSVQFFSTQVDLDTIAPIYYSIGLDHAMLWQREKKGEEYFSRLTRIMKKQDVKSVGQGKTRQWRWRNLG